MFNNRHCGHVYCPLRHVNSQMGGHAGVLGFRQLFNCNYCGLCQHYNHVLLDKMAGQADSQRT
ncbi:MAG: hypothetical protein LBS74_11715 [Oscillospiraceae bacterium]|nr:hypothetical protein [Oscillospiraceae bacterium]